ncbi:putative DNA polymerase delta subunit 4 [Fonsecaea pedrosoi]|nr:putative DNA polymerase delta subunit 4 [Fonsecaea pedrosoi]
MPRTRKSATRPSQSLQSTLSFNNKSARVTKPSANAQRDEHSASAKKLVEVADRDRLQTEPEVVEVKNELTLEETEEGSQDIKAEVAVPSQSVEPEEAEQEEEVEEEIEVEVKTRSRRKQKAQAAGDKDQRELAAEKVTDSQLKKYWQAEEDSRLAPRVHQSDLSLHEKILRHFDLSSQYGPCIGIPRLQRWRRANTLGLEPPVEVLAVLLREQDGAKTQGCGKMAYIDELSGGRVVLVE